jgi:DNA-binding NarL/FixJ family response regulator
MTLTPRQAEVANLLLQGKRTKQIGAELGIDEKVVSQHLVKMYHKYGIHDGARTIKLAVALYYERHPEARV